MTILANPNDTQFYALHYLIIGNVMFLANNRHILEEKEKSFKELMPHQSVLGKHYSLEKVTHEMGEEFVRLPNFTHIVSYSNLIEDR